MKPVLTVNVTVSLAILVYALCMPTVLHAKDKWLCTEESSQKQGNNFYSCGIGADPDESSAREKAFDSAKAEFAWLCASSDFCRGHKTSIEPRRTTCEKEGQNYKCYRLLVFTISDEMAELMVSAARPVSSSLVLRKGMSKQDLFSTFGSPAGIAHGSGFGGDYLQVFYKGEYCEIEGSRCYVIIKENRVESYQHFKPQLTEDMN